LTSRESFFKISLARACIAFVVTVSAGPPEGGLYLKPPSSAGYARRDDHAVGQPGGPATVVSEDGVGDDRRRRVAQALLDHDVLLITCEHLDGARKRRLGQGVRVHANEQRAGDALCLAELADRLRDSQDVALVKAASEG